MAEKYRTMQKGTLKECVMIDGRVIAKSVLDRVAHDRQRSGFNPQLVVFSATENESARAYTREIARRAEQVGIRLSVRDLSRVGFEQAVSHIREASADTDVDGILLQMPLPVGFDKNACIDAIDPLKDVDGATPTNLGKLILGDEEGMIPCTPRACVEIIRSTGISLRGAHAVVIGQSPVVGRPLSSLLIDLGVTVVGTHIHTRNTPELVREADIVVAAAGKAGLVKKDWIKPGAIVIDVGINSVDGVIVGDVDPDVAKVAGFLTPVPGGVGPVTTSYLMQNTLFAAMLKSMAAEQAHSRKAVLA